MPRISVIVPVYNVEKYLSQCLTSILSQSFDDFEVICIDDCSIDGSCEVLEDFRRNDGRIRLVKNKKNMGTGAVRNIGIRIAASPFLAFVDSDDYIDKDMLKSLEEAAGGPDVDVVAAGYRSVSSSNVINWESVPQDGKIIVHNAMNSVIRKTPPHFWDKLWRRTLFVDNFIFCPEHLITEDLPAVLPAFMKARKAVFIREAFYNYRQHGGKSSEVNFDHIIHLLIGLDVVKDFLIREKIWDREQSEFGELVKNIFRWYSNKVIDSDAPQPAKEQVLRYCTIVCGGYLEFDAKARNGGSSGILSESSEIGWHSVLQLPSRLLSVFLGKS
jgi:glycosyltransferase involved in cell wall biosynthesis